MTDPFTIHKISVARQREMEAEVRRRSEARWVKAKARDPISKHRLVSALGSLALVGLFPSQLR